MGLYSSNQVGFVEFRAKPDPLARHDVELTQRVKSREAKEAQGRS